MSIGARYLEKGSRVQYATYPYSFNTASGEFRIREQYVVLPLLIEARPFPARRLFVTLGPELGILLAANLRLDETRTSGGTPSAYQLDEDIREHLNKADWSLSVGAGWEFPIAGNLASLGFRYAHGLTDVTRSGVFLSEPTSVWKNRSLETYVGLGW